jgi:tetratricopeptide (TPR) repeat protein
MSGKSRKKATVVPSRLPTSPAGEMPGVKESRSLESENRPAGLNDRWLVSGVCIFLAATVWLVFGQTLGHEFVNFDDDLCVYDNPVVQKGLTWEGFRWALTYGQIGHWHPLTWLSHMLDCQLYGLRPGGHHLTNLLLHGAAAILLFLVLRRMTGFLWRSAFVAAVFAIHPLRAESVAWVAERKDVLSAFFFMLTLGAYVRYVQRRSKVEGRESSAGSGSLALDPRRSTLDYCLVVLCFALGLLSKNMLMTMPFVLLLLDYWPLNRLSGFTPQVLLRGVAEKIPLFILTIGSCVATALVPEKVTADKLSFGLRMENAVVSYVTYLWQMIHPSGLACLYPNPTNYLPFWQAAGALMLLLAISGAVWAFRKTHPWLVVGWLWYLGMMIPVIGIVQISVYTTHADRYTYLPQIGLYLLLTWTAADLCAGWRHRRVVLGGLATVILVALIFCARTQTMYWRNSELLWTHTLACTSDNYVAHDNLGNTLLQQNKVDEAITHFQEALQIKPDYAQAWYNLGNALLQKGQVDEAITHFQKALQIKPDYAGAYNNLGYALLQKGQGDEAIAHFQEALQIKPDYAQARYNLGYALLQKGQGDEAIAYFQEALQIKPDYAEAWYNLGYALFQKGQVDEAIAHYQKALQIKPDDAEAHNNLGNALLQKGQVDEAIAHYQKALQIKPDDAEAHNNLGCVLLQRGQVDEAIVHYQKALQIKPDNAKAHNNLGSALLIKGQVDEAIAHYQKALQIKSDDAEVHNNLGYILLQKGKVDEATVHFQKALKIKPDYAEAHYNFGNALLQKGRVDEAIAQYQQALQIRPDFPGVLKNLAWLLATCPDAHLRDGVQAVKYAGRACELTHYGVASLVGTLAAAYAEAGRYDEAMAAAQKACALATAAGERDLLERNQKLLVLYRAHQPYHEVAGKVVPAAP